MNVGFLLSPYFYWFYTPVALLWKLLLFFLSLWQSPHPQEFPVLAVASLGGVWRFSESDIYIIRIDFRSTYWIGSWILVLGSAKIIKIIQGVPKVHSSNFMHYNFWSKLYFYMKFLENVYFSMTYSHVLRISVTGMLFLLLLFFLSHTAAIAAWCGIQLVDPQMIIFNFFITWCTGASSTPKQYLFTIV